MKSLIKRIKKLNAPVVVVLFLLSCSAEPTDKDSSTVGSDLNEFVMIDSSSVFEFLHFPIPDLDSIFPYFETSGAVEYAPSERYYNPTDSGIFVSYSLFDQKKLSNAKYSFDEQHIGMLITHTYRKPVYGWSETDKDQSFIWVQLDGDPIKIGKSIQVGHALSSIITELGRPIYQSDSTFTFLGKNKVVGQFKVVDGKVTSFTYGRYNLTDEVFQIDSTSRRKIIEETIHHQR